MAEFIYRVFLVAYRSFAKMLSLFNPKVARWVEGRRNWEQKWVEQLQKGGISDKDTVVWLHASSLGEFEQGRPLLEGIRHKWPERKIVVTFYSPSGYEVRKNYPGANAIGYLPFDHPGVADQFLKLLNPSLVLWVKYEYWYYTLKAIHNRKVPLLLVSGIFRPSQPFFKWYGSMHRQMLQYFSHLFVQNKASAGLIGGLVPSEKVTVAGDTRFDSVLEVAGNWQSNALVEQWLDGCKKVIVAGSTWDSDEEEIIHYVKANPDVKWIIAPHNLEKEILTDTLNLFQAPMCYSALLSGIITDAKLKNVLIIDNIGMLRYLYQYGTICYLGGGFTGDGVHNVLEAAVYGRPVIHGPEFSKFAEAIGLHEAGGSFVIESSMELESLLQKLWQNKEKLLAAGEAAGDFVKRNAGATGGILEWIQLNLLFTNSKNR